MNNGLALYFHFPFCKEKCFYCNFNSYSHCEHLISDYFQALPLEVERYVTDTHQIVNSVYLGGGTPSYLPFEYLIGLLQYIKTTFLVRPETEITLEVNPGAIAVDDLIHLRNAGVNRLSIGLQAVQDSLLKSIGRIHTWSDFLAIYELIREIGFENVGVDLMFGLPGQSLKDWQETLETVGTLNIEHISAYGLHLEPGTPLERMVTEGTCQMPDEDLTAIMMQVVMEYLPKQGYEHYEISNYAKPGCRSAHNLSYWIGRDYLGFGAGACSTRYGERWSNLKSPEQYIQNLQKRCSVVATREKIDKQIALTERLMLGLRLREGVNLRNFGADFGVDLLERTDSELQNLIDQELLMVEDGFLRLSDRGVLLSNQVISRLFRCLERN